MFVTISRFRAKIGEEDAIIALHEDWQRNQQYRTRDYLSGELIRSIRDSREFQSLIHFESQEAAQRLANDPEHNAWYRHLMSLTEDTFTLIDYQSEWWSVLLQFG